MTLIAVYGTLRYGGRANHLLRGCKRIGEDEVAGKLYNLGNFPGLKVGSHTVDGKSTEGDYVKVDVYDIPEDLVEKTLFALDVYEGYNEKDNSQSLYTRFRFPTRSGKLAWVYEYKWQVHSDLVVPSGDWFDVT